MRGRSGLALLVVSGVLGVMAVLTICFVSMAQLERKASQRRIHQTQAILLARSGIEDALARLNAGQDAADPANAYRGEDWDGNGQLSVFEADQEIFRRTGAGTAPDTSTCPVEQAMRPSFFVRVPGADNPDTRSVDGRQRGRSGALSTDGGLTYSLKVEDESGKINVNGGFLDAADRDNAGAGDGIPDHRDPDVKLTASLPGALGWNFQLCRILNVLGAEPELGMPNLGNDILERRPLGGYASMLHLQSLLGTATDLSPYLTTSSWIDRKVLQPNGYSYSGNAMNEIKVQRTLVLDPAGRPPVNLNTASRPVLRALMRGLWGYQRTDYSAPFSVPISPPGLGSAGIVNVFVDQMLIRRASLPFRDRTDFSLFCDTLPPLVTLAAFPGLTPTYASNTVPYLPDLIKANFDPNTALNKDLPDQLKFRFVDKSDLRIWSTEGCFEPTGLFRIAGLGRVRGRDGKLLAEHGLSLSVRIYDLLRQTTQKDFLAGRRLEECHSLSSMGGVLRTTGAGASWPDWSGSPGQGLSTLSYPNPPTVPSADAADFDGYLGLATVEATPGEVPAGGALRFMHHLDDAWAADEGIDLARVPGPSDGKLTAPLSGSVWPSAAGVEPNTLRPDGLHIQRDRCPAFLASNMPAPTVSGLNYYNRGVVGFWVKPSMTPGYHFDFSIVKGATDNPNQALLFRRSVPYGINTLFDWAVTLDNNMIQSPTYPSQEVRFNSPADFPRRAPMLRWVLQTALFDTDETATGRELQFDLRSFDHVFTRSPNPLNPPFNTTASENLCAYDTVPGTAARMVLGAPGTWRIFACLSTSNDVIDEVCVCDFGDSWSVPSTPAALRDAWASARFNEGRYYKEDDATFLSTPLSPDVGSTRLLWARWTAYLPGEKRKEIEIAGNAIVDRLPDSRLLNSAVELELLDSAGNFTSAPLQALTQGGTIGRTLDAFRYRVTFKPNLPSLSDPVLESPFFDDVTFAWQPASGPRVLVWGER